MKKNITKTIMSSIIISGLMIGAYAPIAEDVEKTILKEHFYDKEGYEKIIVRKDFFNSEKGAISSYDLASEIAAEGDLVNINSIRLKKFYTGYSDRSEKYGGTTKEYATIQDWTIDGTTVQVTIGGLQLRTGRSDSYRTYNTNFTGKFTYDFAKSDNLGQWVEYSGDSDPTYDGDQHPSLSPYSNSNAAYNWYFGVESIEYEIYTDDQDLIDNNNSGGKPPEGFIANENSMTINYDPNNSYLLDSGISEYPFTNELEGGKNSYDLRVGDSYSNGQTIDGHTVNVNSSISASELGLSNIESVQLVESEELQNIDILRDILMVDDDGFLVGGHDDYYNSDQFWSSVGMYQESPDDSRNQTETSQGGGYDQDKNRTSSVYNRWDEIGDEAKAEQAPIVNKISLDTGDHMTQSFATSDGILLKYDNEYEKDESGYSNPTDFIADASIVDGNSLDIDIKINPNLDTSYSGSANENRNRVYGITLPRFQITGAINGGIYDMSKDYFDDEVIENNMLEIDAPERGIYNGVYSNKVSYSDLEWAIRSSISSKGIGKGILVNDDSVDIIINGNESSDYSNTYMDSGNFTLNLRSNGNNQYVINEYDEDLIINVPYLNEVSSVVETKEYSNNGLRSNHKVKYENGEINIYINSNSKITLNFDNFNFVNLEVGVFNDDIGGLYTFDATNYIGEGIKEEEWNNTFNIINQTNGDVSNELFINIVFNCKNIIENINSSTINNYLIIKDELGNQIANPNVEYGIILDGLDFRQAIVISNYDYVKIESIQVDSIINDFKFIENVSLIGDNVIDVSTEKDNFAIEVIGNEQYENSVKYLETDLGINQMKAAYERGAIDSLDSQNVMNTFDVNQINYDFKNVFSNEMDAQQYLDENEVNKLIEDSIASLGFVSGYTTLMTVDSLINTFLPNWLPYARDEEGNLINENEWSSKTISVNGVPVDTPMIPLFNGDIIEVRFTHNRTINEDATIYGEGTAFITLSMIEVE